MALLDPRGWAYRRIAWEVLVTLSLGAAATQQTISHIRDSDPQAPLYALLSALLIAPLPFRHRYPLATFGAVATIAAVQLVAAIPLAADVSVLVALYSVAAAYPLRKAFLAVGITEIGAVLAAWLIPHALQVEDAIVVLTVFVLAATMTGAYVRRRRLAIAELVARNEQLLRDRETHVRLATAEERNRIARDMHDVIAHSIAVMITLASAAERKVRGEPDRAEEALIHLAETGRTALSEARQLVGTLGADNQAPHRPQRSVGDLEDIVQRVTAAGLPTSLSLIGAIDGIPPRLGVAIYRIVQESLTNALKHAVDPSTVRVTVTIGHPDVLIVVSDDGNPISATSAESFSSGGHGLTGMRERAISVGGALAAGADSSGGWTVKASLPFPATPNLRPTQ